MVVNDSHIVKIESRVEENKVVIAVEDETYILKKRQEEKDKREHQDLREKFLKLVGTSLKQPKVAKSDPLENVETISEREWRKIVGMYNTIADIDLIQLVSMDRVKKSLLLGIPDSLRGEIWCMLCQVKREKAMHAEDMYYKLTEMENPEDEYCI